MVVQGTQHRPDTRGRCAAAPQGSLMRNQSLFPGAKQSHYLAVQTWCSLKSGPEWLKRKSFLVPMMSTGARLTIGRWRTIVSSWQSIAGRPGKMLTRVDPRGSAHSVAPYNFNTNECLQHADSVYLWQTVSTCG